MMQSEPSPPAEGEQEVMSAEKREQVRQVLAGEYTLLASALSSVWSASLLRTSLFLAVLSAVGVALGFAAQVADGVGGAFITIALVSLPLALFLGLATFARLVEIQREAIVYIVGMNRIRHFMAETAPLSRPYLVLPTHDDELGLYRSQGTGIRLRPPRYPLVFALIQTQGIVAVMSAALAGAIAGFVMAPLNHTLAWIAAPAAFAVALVLLMGYWRRSFGEMRAALRPISPTPPEGVEATI